MIANTQVSAQSPDIESTGQAVPDQTQNQFADQPDQGINLGHMGQAPDLPSAQTQSNDETQMLTDYLAKYNASCPLCRYNLRGLTSGTCPECGNALMITVGLVEPFMSAWICTAATLCASAGIGAWFLFMVIFFGLPRGGGVEGLLTHITIFCFIGSIPFAGVAVWMRRKFMRLQRSTQWIFTGISIMAVLTMFILFVVSVSMNS